MGGSDQTHRRRAWICGFQPDDRRRPPFGKRWPRRPGWPAAMRATGRSRTGRSRARDGPASAAQAASLRPAWQIGTSPSRASADVQRRQRDRGEEKDLAPDGKQRRGKPHCRFQPSKRSLVALNQSPHSRRTQPARVGPIASWPVASKPTDLIFEPDGFSLARLWSTEAARGTHSLT